MKKSRGIAFRLNVFVVGLLICACGGIIAVSSNISSTAFEKHVEEATLPAMMDGVLAAVDKQLLAPSSALRLMARHPMLMEWIEQGEDPAKIPLIFEMGRNFVDMYRTDGVNILLKEKLSYYELAGGREAVKTFTQTSEPWFFAFGESRTPLMVNIYPANDPAYANVAFINLRIDRNGEFLGIISTRMDVNDFAQRISRMTVGKRGATFMARRSGELLIHKDAAKIGTPLASFPGYAGEAARLLSSEQAEFSYTNEAGEHILVFSHAIPLLDAVLICEANMDELLSGLDTARWYSLGVGGLVLLVGVFVSVLLIRTVTVPLHQTIAYAEDVAAGRATQENRLGTERGDELGTLARALQTMVENLKASLATARQESVKAREESERAGEAVRTAKAAEQAAEEKSRSLQRAAGKLETVAGVVASATERLSVQVGHSEQGAREQAARVTETATAMDQMTGTVADVARNAQAASEASIATRSKAEAGAGVVLRAVQSIQQVQTQAQKLRTDMETLDENTRSISRIMGVISDIADQTNLLALNAAIEAARAGDAGRGFAVVADEVRKLAEKTMASTTEVGDSIRAIQQSAARSMEQMDSSVRSIEEATAFANQSGAALQEIVAMADATAEQVKAISDASKQQSESSEAINVSVVEVNAIAGDTAATMEEAARSVSELASQAQALAGLIEDMKRG